MTPLELHLTAGAFTHRVNLPSLLEAQRVADEARCDIAVAIDSNDEEHVLKAPNSMIPRRFTLNGTYFFARNRQQADRIRETCAWNYSHCE